jgi:phage tail tube protein FII
MADATIYTMESVNLICGDVGGKGSPGISTHLVLQELKLPTLEESYADHNPGGAPIAIEIPTHMNKLEATFNLAGWDPKLMAYIGQEDPFKQKFTAYGLIRNRRTAKAMQAIAVMEGRLGRVNPTAFSRGNLMAHEYSIKGITHYELKMAMNPNAQLDEIYFWDFFSSVRRIGGKDLNKEMITLLRIPGNATDTQGSGVDNGGGNPTSPSDGINA